MKSEMISEIMKSIKADTKVKTEDTNVQINNPVLSNNKVNELNLIKVYCHCGSEIKPEDK